MHAITELVNARTGGRPYEDHRERPWAEVVADDPDLAGREHFTFPHDTVIHWCRRI